MIAIVRSIHTLTHPSLPTEVGGPTGVKMRLDSADPRMRSAADHPWSSMAPKQCLSLGDMKKFWIAICNIRRFSFYFASLCHIYVILSYSEPPANETLALETALLATHLSPYYPVTLRLLSASILSDIVRLLVMFLFYLFYVMKHTC